jgi:hypothetical protein
METNLLISEIKMLIPIYASKCLNLIWNLIIGILFYRMVNVIELSIRNRNFKCLDIIYIFLNLYNQYLFFRTYGVGLKLYARMALVLMIFFILDIMYKEKILCKKKDENNKEEKPHAD